MAADLNQKQENSYTYFVHTTETFTWIDHIMVNDHDLSNINECTILSEESDNVSDHLPILIDFHFYYEQPDGCSVPKHPDIE